MKAPADSGRAAELAGHYALCEAMLRERNRDAWLAALFAPEPARSYLHAIHAFAMEIDEVRAKVTQPLLGEMRLRWWADSLATPSEGGGAAHPVADAIDDTIAARGLSRDDFATFLDAHVADLYDQPVEALSALVAHRGGIAAAPLRWSAQCLGAPASASGRLALEQAGAAIGLIGVMRELPRGGARFLPLELLVRHEVSPQEARAGIDSASLRATLCEMREMARTHFEAARAAAVEADEATRAAMLPTATAPLYLELMEKPDYKPFQSLIEPPPWRRQWRLWRAARAGF